MIERLAWVTSRPARGRDEDEPLGVAALERAGVRAEVVDWDDPAVDWARFDRVVLRSAWDYPERLAEFLPWVDRVVAVTELVNHPDLLRWSMDKRYLSELAAAGVPVTPTEFVRPGADPAFPAGEFVIKPAVGAGSRDVSTYGPDQHEAAGRHVARLHGQGRVGLVQPLLAAVATDGEWPHIFFEGRFSHAANKRVSIPRAGAIEGLFAEETNAAHDPSAEQVAVAQAAVDRVTETLGAPVYARVDVVRDNDGAYCVLEAELVEPSLFLRQATPGAVDRFVAALLR